MKKAAPWIIVIAILAGVSLWYFSRTEPPEAHPSVVTLPQETEKPPPPEPRFPVEPVVSEPEAVVPPLPELAESDNEVAEALSGLVGAETLGAVFILEQIVNRIVATVDSLDSAQVAPLVMPVNPPTGEFEVSGEEAVTIGPGNVQRYAAHMRLVEVLDPESAAALYRRLYPLFQESYELLGYEDAYFNDRLIAIIDHLLATPRPGAAPVLVKPEAVYIFEDQALEALSGGQKILLRIGSENSELVRQKLRDFRDLVAGDSGTSVGN